MAAAAVAETVLASHGGGGGWETALAMTENALDALEGAGEEGTPLIFTHFLWNWAEFAGLRPPLNRCARCACEERGNGVLWYSPFEGALLCGACAGISGGRSPAGFLSAGPGARRWLEAVEDLSPSLLHRYTLDGTSLREARALAAAVMEGALGKRLGTWDF
jgi:DNA repair protein RecO (recombination protein O)